MEETEMCGLIGKRLQSASCRETKQGFHHVRQWEGGMYSGVVLFFSPRVPSNHLPFLAEDVKNAGRWRLTGHIDFYRVYFKYLAGVPSGSPLS